MENRLLGKTGEMVSILGFGCMRLPLLPGGATTDIDGKTATAMLRTAIDRGVNYVDTAYPYHGTGFDFPGQSEPFVGKALQDGYREKVKIATKLPSWLITSRDDMDRYLNHQLERLQTDHIDFYLVHAINSHFWPNLLKNDVKGFLDAALADGRIRNAGFSFHDKLPLFKEVVDAYDWSFCQIQYNYMDQNFQAGEEGLKYAHDRGLGIVIMEPLKGGKLANNIPEDAIKRFESTGKEMSPAAWALHWLWNDPRISVVLSGMSDMEQTLDNLDSAEKFKEGCFSDLDELVIADVRRIFRTRTKVGCTACGYCMPCPAGVDIPTCFTYYNNLHMFGKEEFYRMLGPRQASSCTRCGKCVSHCPQGLQIPDLLAEVNQAFTSKE